MMKEQKYIVENDTFDLDHIFECGQCFRWNKQEDGSYIGVVQNSVIRVKKDDNKIIFEGVSDSDLKNLVDYYFDIERDYNDIKKKLSKVDKYMKNAIEYGSGIRILNQDLWETIISFIISANNNIPRIKKIIENLSEKYGDKIFYEGKCYYTFPTPSRLKNVSVNELRKIGLGFRDVRVYETTKIICEEKVNLLELQAENDINVLRNKLLTLPGVGPKVADCILLFSSLKRLETFPIDVWVRRVMNELYIHKEDETKVKNEEILQIANQKFGNLAGIAQQYLFYWKREN